MSPLISVILPVYNREKFVAGAVQSILDQTYEFFELIIVDDASTDSTLGVIKRFHDERIRILENEENLGVSSSRNKGICEANGEFVAFMDSDDISLPDRLEKQQALLSERPEVLICGSWMRELNSKKVLKYKEKHEEIVVESLLKSPIANPTVMLRKKLMEEVSFDEELKHGEDYDFWSRAMWLGKMYNIQEPLVLYNVHVDQLSTGYKKEQLELDVDIRLTIFKRIAYSEKSFPDRTLKKILLFQEYFEVEELLLFFKWLKVLEKENSIEKVFSHEKFNTLLRNIKKDILFKVFFGNSDIGIDSNWRRRLLVNLNSKEAVAILSEKAVQFARRLIK